jgi:hypothetical protein
MFHRLSLFPLVLSALLLQSFTVANDNYWISFSVTNAYVAKINSSGKILMGPTEVASAGSRPYAAFITALSNAGSGDIYFWMTTHPNNRTIEVQRGKIHKANPSKPNLQAFGIAPIGVLTLGITQDLPGFIVFERPLNVLKGFLVNGSANYGGNSFRVCPRTDGSVQEGGVSADGRMAWSWAPLQKLPKLYVQPLSSNGLPSGNPQVVGTGSFTSSTDISNPIGGKRIITYFENNGSSKIMTQIINAENGEKLDTPRVIGSNGTDFSDLAIDPAGKFVLYFKNDPNCGRPSLFLQPIDSNGIANGKTVNMMKCSTKALQEIQTPSGLDILKD